MLKSERQLLAVVMGVCSLEVACGSTSSGVTNGSSDARTSSVTDARNDLLNDGPSYRDVLKTEIIKTGQNVTFRAELAGAVPSRPLLPPSVVALVWEWNIQSDDRFPTGFPNAASMRHWPELQAQLVWNGSEFKAFLIDRRPSLMGGEVVVTSIPFSITGAQLELTADRAGIQIPDTFGWVMVTNDWLVPRGQVTSNDQVRAIDVAPDQPPPTGPLPVPANLVKF